MIFYFLLSSASIVLPVNCTAARHVIAGYFLDPVDAGMDVLAKTGRPSWRRGG
jgi:hypothetical protein